MLRLVIAGGCAMGDHSDWVLLILFVVYLLPTIIAAARWHYNAGAIFILNLFLGWTFLGWLAALIWACTDSRRDPVRLPVADNGVDERALRRNISRGL
jgi:hypothetical protein